MSISTLFNYPRVLHQKCREEYGVPEPDIAASLDAGSLLVLDQGGSEITINPESVPELCRMLRQLKQLSDTE